MCTFKQTIVRVCVLCRQAFQPVKANRCYWCGNAVNKDKCRQCKARGKIERHVALYAYNDAMRAYIDLFKFSGGYHLREVFSKELQREIRKLGHRIIVPIPSSRETLDQRGFNQVEALLDGLVIHSMLKCIAYEKTSQRTLSRIDRLQSTQPFMINFDMKLPDKSEKICLVDDIYTTGQTISHATSCLRRYGFVDIVSVSLAR